MNSEPLHGKFLTTALALFLFVVQYLKIPKQFVAYITEYIA